MEFYLECHVTVFVANKKRPNRAPDAQGQKVSYVRKHGITVLINFSMMYYLSCNICRNI